MVHHLSTEISASFLAVPWGQHGDRCPIQARGDSDRRRAAIARESVVTPGFHDLDGQILVGMERTSGRSRSENPLL